MQDQADELDRLLKEIRKDLDPQWSLTFHLKESLLRDPKSWQEVDLRFAFEALGPDYSCVAVLAECATPDVRGTLSSWTTVVGISPVSAALLLATSRALCSAGPGFFRTARSLEKVLISSIEVKQLVEVQATSSSLGAIATVLVGMPGSEASLTALRECGFRPVDLKEAGFNSASRLKEAGFAASEFKGAGFSAAQLAEVFNFEQLFCMGFSLPELRKAGFSLPGDTKEQIADAICFSGRGSQLRGAGFSISDLEEAGFSLFRIRAGVGFSASEFKKAGFSLSQLQEAGFNLSQVQKAGFNPSELRKAGRGFSRLHLERQAFRAGS